MPGVPSILDDPEKRKQVLNVLAVGGSLNDAAALLKIEKSTLWRYRQANPDFELDVKHAEAAGKVKHLKNISDVAMGTANEDANWRASAFFLACKYPEEWSQKAQLQVDHRGELDMNVSGEVGLSIKTNLEACLERFDRFARQGVGGGTLQADGN